MSIKSHGPLVSGCNFHYVFTISKYFYMKFSVFYVSFQLRNGFLALVIHSLKNDQFQRTSIKLIYYYFSVKFCFNVYVTGMSWSLIAIWNWFLSAKEKLSWIFSSHTWTLNRKLGLLPVYQSWIKAGNPNLGDFTFYGFGE